ncbi:MAG TPA: hypothetical protein DEP27_01195 [Ruminococcaceae bacterium]|jgi:hypothetical protein|nr:hypothetical protein [Oscillospiraceae bacterium]
MILCFGLSWPISIYRSYVSRTAKGKSIFFEVFLWIGYVFGIARKFMQYSIAGGTGLNFLFYLGLVFYFLNIVEISIDMALYFRNAKLDRERENTIAVNEEVITEEVAEDKE